MKLLVKYAIIFICVALSVNAESDDCSNVDESGQISASRCLSRQKRQGLGRRKKNDLLPGGVRAINVDDPDLKLYLTEAITEINAKEDPDYEPLRIVEASVQVVAGTLYRFKVEMKRDGKPVVCKFKVWERVWVPNGREVDVECENEKSYKLKQEPITHIGTSERVNSLNKAPRTRSSSSEEMPVQTRSKRSIHHNHHHRPRPDHSEEHHQSLHERHQNSAHKKMEDVKGEVLFESFIEKYERRYANDLEHQQRLRIFKRNLHKIEMLNKHEQGTAKYGITEFADMTEKEYLRKTGLIFAGRHENSLGNPIAQISEDVTLPDAFDWRDKGAITGVKNQGNCGSCWSFSVTGNIEGLHAIKTGKLESYSEQELLDCDTTDNACNGGYMDDAFKAIEKIGGLELEEEYPYLARKQKKCMFNQTLSHVKVKGVVDMPKGDEVAMQKFLVSTGPISIGINANAMQFYRGGISHPWKILCKKSNLDHGVLLVGYGKKEYPTFNKTLPYWTIKNSWGPKWGEQGYYRVYRGDNTCGVAEMASSAVLEE